jgi:tRNA(Ile)-lysidine synthase
MLKKVETYILKNKLLAPDSTVIVGVSGGADSVALVCLLKSMDYKCIVAHCNFQLRGSESDNDAVFVEELAKKLDLPLCKVEFDTLEFAQENKISIELAARELRYKWFENMRLQYKADAIAVAHHADDNVETLLMNITRGTGIRGLTAIPKQNGYVVRPLLECTRGEIIRYLRQIGQDFVTDASNAENKYTRNRFRNEIIPMFEKVNPSFSKTISMSIKRFEEIEKIYNEKIETEKANIVSSDNENVQINIPKLKALGFSNSMLYEILIEYNFHPATIDKIYACVDDVPGAVFYSGTHRLLHDREYLIVNALTAKDDIEYFIDEVENGISEPLNLSITRRINDGEISKSKNLACFDADKLQFPLKLRHWKKGDVFIPFGMNFHKKISDFFIDNKVNRFEKENVWLLLSGNEIIWVVGYRLDNRYKVNNDTKQIIEFQIV